MSNLTKDITGRIANEEIDRYLSIPISAPPRKDRKITFRVLTKTYTILEGMAKTSKIPLSEFMNQVSLQYINYVVTIHDIAEHYYRCTTDEQARIMEHEKTIPQQRGNLTWHCRFTPIKNGLLLRGRMNECANKKSPPLSGHSEQGAMPGQGPFDNSSNSSITYRHENFNRFKFNLGLLQKVKGSGGQYTALCPAHDDSNSSLSVKIVGDKVLLHCFAGCATESIIGALGLPMSSLFLGDDKPLFVGKKPKQKPRQINSVTYEYKNPDGSLAYRKIRYEYSNGTKSFAFFTPNRKKGVGGTQRVPFNLPDVMQAETVYFVEGEKAANTIIQAGRVATSLDAGAN